MTTIKRNLFRDVLRDTNSKKYSLTKVAGFSTLLIFIAASFTALAIMVVEREIDHVFIGEIIALLLTLLGFKNFKGNFNKTSVETETIKKTTTKSVDRDELEDEDNDEIG